MAAQIVSRIERELGFQGVAQALATLPASDLGSLLLDVFRKRAARRKLPDIVAQRARDLLVAPSSVDARRFTAFDTLAFEAAAQFAAVELSPVGPFSSASTLGGTSQNNVLTTLRNAEVLGDPTIALALEVARRRGSEELVQLCASQRVIRLQPFDAPGLSPHFRIFALVSAGRDTGASRFETAQLREQVRVYLRLIAKLNAGGFSLQNPLVEFTDMAALGAALTAAGISQEEVRSEIRAHWMGGSARFLGERGVTVSADSAHPALAAEVLPSLRDEFPEVQFRVNQERLEGLGYYGSFALRISVTAPNGQSYPVADGGFTDWTARLRNNQKERLLISGIGSEFVCKMFRTLPD